ncbi:MAG: bla [Gammaproteobacteria bacterium]|nr:bla [Gammaproteobacteria bacterium]
MKYAFSKYSFLRTLLLISIAGIFAGICMPSFAKEEKTKIAPLQKQLADVEATTGGRLGISAVNTANNERIQYRADERFPTQCTSKVIGVSAMLKKSMTNPSLLQEKIIYTKKDLTNWTPITEKHVADGMTVAELGAAAIEYSDNTAMNLLLKKIDGIQGMNHFARSIKNATFRQDHDWPAEAMSGGPGNITDSATPASMEESLQKLALGNILAPYQRNLLVSWLKNNTTGNARIRAGIPKNWIVGDKTGTGFYYGTTNDIGIIWPPQCAPVVVAIYYTNDKKDAKKREDILAATTHMVLQDFAKSDACIRKNLS